MNFRNTKVIGNYSAIKEPPVDINFNEFNIKMIDKMVEGHKSNQRPLTLSSSRGFYRIKKELNLRSSLGTSTVIPTA